MFYGYRIVAATFVIELIIFGAFLTNGVFLDHVAGEFGWLRATISGAYSVAFMLIGVSAFIGGILNDRFGPRLLVTVSLICLATGYVLLSQVGAMWQWYLFYCLIGLGIGTVEMVPLTTIARWFVRRRGLMTGIAQVGVGLGIMLVPLGVTLLITSADWRYSYLALGGLVIAVCVPAAQVMKRDPGTMGLLPDGERHEREAKPYVERGLTVRRAVGTWQLWVLCAAYFTNALSRSTIAVHLVPHAKSLGMIEVQANSLISVVGGVSIGGRLGTGYCGDRIGNRRTLVLCLALLAATLGWALIAREPWQLYILAAFYGLNHGGISTVISPAVAELFGTRSQGSLLGVVALVSIVSAGGPLMGGYLFDVYGSYQPAFMLLLGLAIIGLVLSSLLKPVKGGQHG